MMQEAAEGMKAIKEFLTALGGDPGKYRRQTAKKMKAIVSEIYSSPRITVMAKLLLSFGIIPGMAFDLTTIDEDGNPWGL